MHILHYKGERISKTRYVHCLCSAKTHMFLNHEQSIQDSFNESIFSMFCHINKWPANYESLGLMPFNLPARLQLRLYDRPERCAPISRSHQDVHRPRGLLSDNNQQIDFTYIFSLSPVCKAKVFWNAAGPTNFTSNSFYCTGTYVLRFGSSFACFHIFCFRYEIHEPLTILAGQMAPRNK